MLRLFTHHSTARIAGSERMVRDDRGRLGSAARESRGTPGGALRASSREVVASARPTHRPIPTAGRR